MTAVAGGAGIALAWLGGSILVLADARRGIALGGLLAALGVALAEAAGGDFAGAVLLAAGGLLAVGVGLRGNPRRGWGLLQAPSTPRVVLSAVLGGAALWLALGMIDRPGWAEARAAALLLVALGAGRLLAERDPRAGLAAASLAALGTGALAGMTGTGAAGTLLGGIVAVGLNLLPTPSDAEAQTGAQRG